MISNSFSKEDTGAHSPFSKRAPSSVEPLNDAPMRADALPS
jgi:hypothetical protein